MIYTMNIEKYLTDALAQKLPVLEFSKSINMNDIDGFIQKPFSDATFLKKIKELLGEKKK